MLNLSTFTLPVAPRMAPQPRNPTNQDQIRARLEHVMREHAQNRQNRLAEMTGLQPAELSKILSGAKPITYANLRKLEAGTGVRLEWLEFGMEPVLHPGGRAPERPEPVKEGEKLRDYIKRVGIGTTELAKRLNVNKSTVSGYFTSTNIEAQKRKQILVALEATEDAVFGSASPTHQHTQKMNYPIHRVSVASRIRMVTRIPVAARAGFDYDTYFNDHEHERDAIEVPDSWIQKPKLKQAVIEINGDSMETTLRAGYEVLAYRVDPSDWEYVDKIVAVIYRDQFTIKRVSDNQLITGGLLILTSDNPVGGTRRIPKDDIVDIWQVYRIIKGEL